MYYKIINTESKVYKKLFALRTKEIKKQAENKMLVEQKVGLKFNEFLGYVGQQNFHRVTQYEGFVFLEKDKVDFKIWKLHPQHSTVFIPNRKTKQGREMAKFLNSGLQSSNFHSVFEVFNFEIMGRFTFPYVEIFGKTIVLFLDRNLEVKKKDVIEITKTEFEKIRKSKPTHHNANS